ncbi:MAG: putative molybdenum carrier protein [Phycisphaerales bacterium]
MNLELIVTGGQSGVDQAAWRAAKRCGIATGGWMPRGFKTEDGNHPEFAELYGAKEHPSSSYRDRTISNVGLVDKVLIFNQGPAWSSGTACAVNAAKDADVRWFVWELGRTLDSGFSTGYIAQWIRRDSPQSLMVGGNRESRAPGIGAAVEAYLVEVFTALKGSR